MKNKDCLYISTCKNKCSASCVRYNQMRRLLELSNLPKARQALQPIYSVDADAKNYEKLGKIKKNIVSFVEQGKNLYICSNYCGNAKTSWAIKLMLKYFDQTWHNSYDITRALFVHVPTLLIDLKRFDDRPEYIDRILDADLVVWDDFASSDKLTNYEHEQILRFIDYRLSSGKSNIYTSNVTNKEDLCKLVGQRLGSRVFTLSEVIEMKSDKDFRSAGGKH